MVKWGNPTRQISTLYFHVTTKQKDVNNLLTGAPGVTDGSRPPCCFFRQADDVLTVKQDCLPVRSLVGQNHWDAYKVSDIKEV